MRKQFWAILAILLCGLIEPCARAAVQVWNVAVTGSGPCSISYNLLCSNGGGPSGMAAITAMTVKILNQSGTVVRTMSISDTTKWTSGAHPNGIGDTTGVIWDGTDDYSVPVPNGVYSAQVEVTGAAQATIAVIAGPAAASAGSDGRFSYNGGAIWDITSPYHNNMYWPSTDSASSSTGRNGTYVVKPSLSNSFVGASVTYSGGVDQPTFQGFSRAASVLSDNYVVVTDSSATTGGKVFVLSPSCSASNTIAQNVVATYGSAVYTRGTAAFGTKDSVELFYVDEAGTPSSSTPFASGSKNIRYARFGTGAVSPTTIVASTSFPSTVRSVAVNRAKNVLWVAGSSLSVAGATFVQRWTRTGSLPGTWTQDTAFTYTIPSNLSALTGGTYYWVALSPDETMLWVSANGGTTSGANNLKAVNSTTGADIAGQSLTSGLPNWTEAVSTFGGFDGSTYSSSNLVIATFGNTTQTTASKWYSIAPADSGSVDKTRSALFNKGTAVSITAGPTVTPTYQGGTFAWTTDFFTDSKVEIATDAGFTSIVKTTSDPTLVQSHSVLVTGVNQATTYYYRVTSATTGLTSAVSTGTFTTNTLAISGLSVSANENSGTATWTTSEAASSIVNVGVASGTYFKTYSSSTLSTSHTVLLGSLPTNTKYYFQVRSGNGTGQSDTVLPEGDLTTHSSSLANTNVVTTATSGTVTFDTDGTPDAPATVVFKWGATTAPATVLADSGSGNSHVYTITGLNPGTTYYYSVTLSGTSIPTRVGPVCGFTTPGSGPQMSVTQGAAASVALSMRTNLDAPADGAIAQLSRQGLPGTPVTTALPVQRFYNGVVASNGYLYCIGGRDQAYTGTAPNASKLTVYVAPINADGSVGTWVDNASNYLPTGLERACINNQCFAYNGYIYVAGGYNASGAAVSTVLYSKQDPLTGNLVSPIGSGAVWQTTTAMVNTMYLGSATVADGYVLVTGGYTYPGTSDQAYMNRIKPDGTLGSWFASRSLSETDSLHRTLINNHTAYVVGGQQNPGTGLYNTANIATIQPNRDLRPFFKNTNDPAWTAGIMDNPGTPPDSGRWSMAAGILRGKVVMAGGRLNNGAGATATNIISTSKIAPGGQVNAWSPSSNTYPVTVMDLDGAAWNGNLYAIGGRSTTASSTAVTSVVRIPFSDDTGYAYSGTFESNVIDLTGSNTVTNLRHITVAGTGVSSSSVELRYRYCGVDAAAVFTEWLPTSGPDVNITGGARYFQYQLVLKGDGTSTPSVSGVTITTGSTSDLSVAASVDEPTPRIGDSVVFTFTVSNAGPDDAPSVVLSDNLPNGLTFVSATGGTVGGTGNNRTVTISNIPAGSNAIVTVTATVDPAAAIGSPISNTGSETFSCTDSSSGNDSASATITIAPVSTGVNIPARFGKGAQLATQTSGTGFGDNLSEIDQLFGTSDGGNLRLGITGNLQDSSQNGIIILLDTKSGGNNPFNYTSWNGDGGSLTASGRVYGLNGDTLDSGFNPDYAIDTNLAGGTVYADLYDLQANGNAGSKTVLGNLVAPGSVGFSGGGEMSFDNSNTAGVTGTDPTNAATATTGLEISLPLSRIGSPSSAIKIMVLIQANSDYHSNQTLPGLPDNYGSAENGNLGAGDQNYANIPGRQYVTMTPGWTANDLALNQLPWTYEARVFTGDRTRDNHPPVVNAPAIYNGRTFMVEDIEHSGGSHTGSLVAVKTVDGTVDTTFGAGGRVALDAPATGRVAVRGVGGVVRLYVVDMTGKVYSMDTNGGNIRTAQPATGVTKATGPAVIDDNGIPIAYYGVLNGTGAFLVKVTDVTTMDSATLMLDSATDITASPSVIRGGGAIQIGTINGTAGKVFSILSDLTPINTVTTANPVFAPTTLSSDSTVFYVGDAPATGNGTFYCFDASTGIQLRTSAMNGGLVDAAFGDYSLGNITNALYFATTTGQLNCVDPATLNSLPGYPSTPLGAIPATGAVTLLNGKVIVPTANGLFAVPSAAPTTYTRFPVEARASTPSSTGRAAGSVMATTATTGLVNGVTVQ